MAVKPEVQYVIAQGIDASFVRECLGDEATSELLLELLANDALCVHG